MSLSDVRDQIETLTSSVEGMGVVHPFQRWSSKHSDFLNHFKDPDTGKINGCCFTRTATAERWLTNIKYVRVYEFLFRMYYGLRDADGSELVFQSLVEAVAATFRLESSETLNGTCETLAPEFGSLAGLAGIQVETVDQRMFGNVLCHYSELRLGAQVTEARQ